MRADGTLDLSDFPRPGLTLLGVDLVDLYADAAEADFAGFASIDVVSIRFSAPLDFATVQDGAALFFVDITAPGQPGFGANRGREFGFDPGKSKYACQNRLTLGNRTTDDMARHWLTFYYMSDAEFQTEVNERTSLKRGTANQQ